MAQRAVPGKGGKPNLNQAAPDELSEKGSNGSNRTVPYKEREGRGGARWENSIGHKEMVDWGVWLPGGSRQWAG